MAEFFKAFPPLICIIYWIFFAKKGVNQLTIFLTLFLVFFVSFSANFFSIYRYLYQLMQLILIGCFLYLTFKSKKISKILIIPLIFLFFIIFSLITNHFDTDAQVQTINFISILGVLGFFSIAFKEKYNIIKSIDFLGNLAFIASVFGLFEFATLLSPRIEGTFTNPNYYALFLGVGFCSVYNNKNQKFFMLKLIVIFLAILLSGSRAGIVFPIIQLLWSLYLRRKYFLLICILTIIISITQFIDLSRGGSTQGSDAERVLFAKIALNMSKDHPYNGVGWGRYPAEFSDYSGNIPTIMLDDGVIDASSQDRRVTHNDLLRILSELGYLAFLFAIYYLIHTFYILVRYRGFGEHFLMPCWLGMILFSLTHNNMNSILFWLFLTMPLYFYGFYKQQKRHDTLLIKHNKLKFKNV